MIVPTSNLFKLAYGKYAIGAYNINNMEQTLGLFKGSIESQSPFIIQLSKGARKHADKEDVGSYHSKGRGNFPRGRLPCTSTMATRSPVTIALNRAFTVR
jgi:fructose/tagatose bisphosphate aldolase